MKKFTTLKEDTLKENAQVTEKFDYYYKSVMSKLETIRHDIDYMKEQQEKDPGNWSYIDSIGHIDELLNEITTFL